MEEPKCNFNNEKYEIIHGQTKNESSEQTDYISYPKYKNIKIQHFLQSIFINANRRTNKNIGIRCSLKHGDKYNRGFLKFFGDLVTDCENYNVEFKSTYEKPVKIVNNFKYEKKDYLILEHEINTEQNINNFMRFGNNLFCYVYDQRIFNNNIKIKSDKKEGKKESFYKIVNILSNNDFTKTIYSKFFVKSNNFRHGVMIKINDNNINNYRKFNSNEKHKYLNQEFNMSGSNIKNYFILEKIGQDDIIFDKSDNIDIDFNMNYKKMMNILKNIKCYDGDTGLSELMTWVIVGGSIATLIVLAIGIYVWWCIKKRMCGKWKIQNQPLINTGNTESVA